MTGYAAHMISEKDVEHGGTLLFQEDWLHSDNDAINLGKSKVFKGDPPIKLEKHSDRM